MKSLTFAAALLVPAILVSGSTYFSPVTVDDARIRAHLARVEQELRGTDVSAWTPAQRVARARNLDVLHAYWVRGVFPKNTDFPGQRVPYFIDRAGTRCAMAHLIEQSGSAEFVARVAATNNNARIRQLEPDPELVAWLGENGLTAAEAARIQPAYCSVPGGLCPADGAPSKRLAAVAAGLSAVTTVWAASGSRSPVAGPLAMGSGVFSLIAGTGQLTKTRGDHALGAVNVGLGATALYLGIRSLTRAGSPTQEPAPPPVASVLPWTGAQGTGLALQIRF